MERHFSLWTLALCLGLLVWVYWDHHKHPTPYDWHEMLTNKETSAKIEPRELIDLGKIIKETESYINQTNAVERLFQRIHQTTLVDSFFLSYIYSDPKKLEISGWPVSDQAKCSRQLDWIDKQLKQHPDYMLLNGQLGRELVGLLDSFGKPEAGTYSGISSWPGSYSLCQRATMKSGEIEMRYCVAMMRFKSWPVNEKSVPRSRIKIGICLPQTCDTSSFPSQKNSIERLIKLELPLFYKENLVFEELYCLPDDRSPSRQIPRAGWILISLYGLWLVTLTFATIKHVQSIHKRPKQEKKTKSRNSVNLMDNDGANGQMPPDHARGLEKIWQSLSLVNSWREFWADSFSETLAARVKAGEEIRIDMRSMNCIRAVMTLTVVYGHCWFVVFAKARSVQLRLDMNSMDWAHLIFSLGRNVDGFFLFFGLLFAHNSLKNFSPTQLGKPQVWLAINANIMSRVWPVYALTQYFARLIAPYLGRGPWWDYGTYKNSITAMCQEESWITSVPHLGSLGRLHANACVPPSWFVISYSQLALFMPLVTYIIYSLPNHFSCLLLVAFAFFISSLNLVLKMSKQTSLRPEAFVLYGGFLPTMLEKYEPTGTMSTLSRVGCVMCGCYLGYLLRQYELGHIKQWPSWLVHKSFLSVTILVHLIVFALPVVGRLLMEGKEQETTFAHFEIGFMCTLIMWLVCLSIETIWLFTTQKSNAIARFMSSSFWTRCNKLGLCILLTHWQVIVYAVSHYEKAAPHGFVAEICSLFCYTLAGTFPISLLLYLTFEAPIVKVLKVMVNAMRERLVERDDVGNVRASHREKLD